MIGIDFTEMDQPIMEYASFLAGILKPEKVYFINVQQDLEVPAELKEAFPEFQEPRDEMLKKEMRSLAETWFQDPAIELDYKIVEGSPRKELLHWSGIKDVDLILLGNKPDHKGSGIIPAQLSRKALCSILFIPDAPKKQLLKHWVAADFSPHSKMAAEEALMLTENHESSSVILHHVYSVPMGYYKTGKTEEQFAQIMLGHAHKKYNRFLESIERDTSRCESFFSYDRDRLSPAEHLVKQAEAHEADMILVGARGRNLLTALFLGSVAEKLIRINQKIPLLLVKRKDQTMDFSSWLDSL